MLVAPQSSACRANSLAQRGASCGIMATHSAAMRSTASTDTEYAASAPTGRSGPHSGAGGRLLTQRRAQRAAAGCARQGRRSLSVLNTLISRTVAFLVTGWVGRVQTTRNIRERHAQRSGEILSHTPRRSEARPRSPRTPECLLVSLGTGVCAGGGQGSRIKDQGSRIKDQGSKMRASQQGARWEPAFLAASAQLLASLRASSTARSGLSEGALRSVRSPAGIWFTTCSTIHCRGETTTTIRQRQRSNNDNDQKQRSETRAVRNPSNAVQPGGRAPASTAFA
jgi:hypothetical protein